MTNQGTPPALLGVPYPHAEEPMPFVVCDSCGALAESSPCEECQMPDDGEDYER